MVDYYRAWNRQEMVAKFERKRSGDFFASEREILKKIGPGCRTILDIGCASGRFAELIDELAPGASFSGIDISANNIERARANYPAATFYLGNALDIDLAERFDLINATGVMQHEPRFKDLIAQMLSWSDRFIMFDVKFAAIPDDLVDIERAYGQIGDDRLYFVVLSWLLFRTYLESLPRVKRVEVWGYETPKNANTVIPGGVEPLVSAGVLIECSDSSAVPSFDVDLPVYIDTGH